MKTLLTVLLLLASLTINAQTLGNCSTCTQPHGVQLAVVGDYLGIGWDNTQWKWVNSTECTKGVSIIINGVERFGSSDSLLFGSAVSSVAFPGVMVAGQQTCVVVRNYCSNPYKLNPSNYVDSAPVCITPPSAPASTGAVACKEGGKYILVKNGTIAKVNKIKCQTMVTQGWVSSCNCQ